MNSLIRADNVLEVIGRSHDGLSHTEIHHLFPMPKSSLSRLLASLVSLQYILVDRKRKRYKLGSRLLTLAGKYLAGMDIFQIGRDYVIQLSKITNETATLAIPGIQDAILIAIENVPQNIIKPPHIGDHMPMYATAAGKAILAHMSEKEIDRYFSSVTLEAITPHTITDEQKLRKELQKIRKGEFAYSWQGFREHVVAIGAPVFNVNNQVIASLSISILSLDAKPNKLNQLKKFLAKVVNEFSLRLGYEASDLQSSIPELGI